MSYILGFYKENIAYTLRLKATFKLSLTHILMLYWKSVRPKIRIVHSLYMLYFHYSSMLYYNSYLPFAFK